MADHLTRRRMVVLAVIAGAIALASMDDAVKCARDYREDQAFLRRVAGNEAIRARADSARRASPPPVQTPGLTVDTARANPPAAQAPVTLPMPDNIGSARRLNLWQRYHTARGFIFCRTQAQLERAHDFRNAKDDDALRGMLKDERCWITDDGHEVIYEGFVGGRIANAIVRYRHPGDDFSLYTQVEALR